MRKGVAQIADWFGEEAAVLLLKENPAGSFEAKPLKTCPQARPAENVKVSGFGNKPFFLKALVLYIRRLMMG